MFLQNKELRLGLLILVTVGTILSGVGFTLSPACGCLVLLCWFAVSGIHLLTEHHRYRRLQRLSNDLDTLLTCGTPLPIGDYDEGELSILANQIQKITLRLLESAESTNAHRVRLADSLADISHQLRTPLTAINLTAAMLRDKDLPEDKRLELARELEKLLERTDWLVDTLLKLSKLDAGTVKLGKDRVFLRELIKRAAEPLEIPMDLRNQRLVIHCGKEQFTGDPVWTGEALGNILKNCVEHTPNGGSITITGEETALFTQLTIEDTGPGFAPQDIPHLFERFYKGSNAAENSYGIGLALARTVITAQNGTIQALNGKFGAKFIIKLYKQVI